MDVVCQQVIFKTKEGFNMVSKRLLRAEEFADLLNVRVSTVRRMILLKKIPTVRICRSVRIPVEEADRLIESGWQEAVGTER